MINLLDPTIIAETSCFVISVICLYRDKSIWWRSMMLFMFITCATEMTGLYLAKVYHANNWLFNIYIIFEAVFTGAMYIYFIAEYNKRLIVINTIAVPVLIALYVYELSLHGFLVLNDITTSAMSVVFIIYSLYYYYLLITDDAYLQLSKHPAFWWVAGSLIFYYISTISTIYYSIFNINNPYIYSYRRYTYMLLNFFLYGSQSYSYLCRYRQRKLTH